MHRKEEEGGEEEEEKENYRRKNNGELLKWMCFKPTMWYIIINKFVVCKCWHLFGYLLKKCQSQNLCTNSVRQTYKLSTQTKQEDEKNWGSNSSSFIKSSMQKKWYRRDISIVCFVYLLFINLTFFQQYLNIKSNYSCLYFLSLILLSVFNSIISFVLPHSTDECEFPNVHTCRQRLVNSHTQMMI